MVDWLTRTCVDEPTIRAVDRNRAQHATSISSSINSNPVLPNLDLRADGMPVDHDKSVIGVVKQEGLADPAEIGLALLVDFNARPDAGVNEQIVAKATAVVEALEKLNMFLGDCAPNTHERILIAQRSKFRRVHPVTLQALAAAEPSPFRDQLGLATKNPKQHFFMIAEEKDGPNTGLTVGSEALDHLSRVWPAIDEIADEYQEDLALGTSCNVLVDLVEKLFEKIEASMDVTDRIGSPTARTDRSSLPSRSETEHDIPLARFAVRVALTSGQASNDAEAKPLLNLGNSFRS
jgi:hypothetical protein